MATIGYRVLRALNYDTAQCMVRDLNDDQARLYLATLNRLSGNEIPERRAALLENLLGAFDIDELAVLLPDDKKQLEELRRLSRLELDDSVAQSPVSDMFQVPVILSFMVEESEAKEINLALDLIIRAEGPTLSCSQALAYLARFYLRQCNPLLAG